MLKKIYDIQRDMEVYTVPMGKIDERMYVVRCGRQLLVVDPNICEELPGKIREWLVTHVTILLTHEHYDHITGVKWLLEQTETETEVICSRGCKEILDEPLISIRDYYDILIPSEEQDYYFDHGLLDAKAYMFDVDTVFESDYSFWWQGMQIECIEAPGHSIGGAMYVIDGKYVFTGDNMVNGNRVITRFPGGNRKDYLRVTKPILQNIEKSCIIFPGHGEIGTLEKLLPYII